MRQLRCPLSSFCTASTPAGTAPRGQTVAAALQDGYPRSKGPQNTAQGLGQAGGKPLACTLERSAESACRPAAGMPGGSAAAGAPVLGGASGPHTVARQCMCSGEYLIILRSGAGRQAGGTCRKMTEQAVQRGSGAAPRRRSPCVARGQRWRDPLAGWRAHLYRPLLSSVASTGRLWKRRQPTAWQAACTAQGLSSSPAESSSRVCGAAASPHSQPPAAAAQHGAQAGAGLRARAVGRPPEKTSGSRFFRILGNQRCRLSRSCMKPSASSPCCSPPTCTGGGRAASTQVLTAQAGVGQEWGWHGADSVRWDAASAAARTWRRP